MTRDDAIELQGNSQWRSLVIEMNKVIENEREGLVNCEPNETIRLQERVRALRFVTRFPGIIAERQEDESAIITKGV